MSSHSPLTRAFTLNHQRARLEITHLQQTTINGTTTITIQPLNHELNTIHLHSAHSTIKAVYHPTQTTQTTQTTNSEPLHLPFIIKSNNTVEIPDPNSVRQYPQAKRRLFENVNENETGELAIQIHKSNIIQRQQQQQQQQQQLTQQQHQSQTQKELEFEPITIQIDYQIHQDQLARNPAICLVKGDYPHLFTNSISARSWVPCLDSLWERCPWELEFIVPRSTPNHHPVTVVASGELLEQIAHPTNPHLSLFHYSQAIPSSVQHIAWVVGALDILDLSIPSNSIPTSPHPSSSDQNQNQNQNQNPQIQNTQESSTQINLLAFCPPNRKSQLLNTVKFLPHALSFFTQEYGSFPYSSYKLAFLDMSNATHSIGATFNSTALTLYPADLLYLPEVIDQVYESKPVLVQSLASQWVGINIIPKSPSDTWLINGLSLYITGLYFKAIWGTNEYRYRIKKDIIRCVELDVNKPPICQPGLPLSIDTEILGFVNLKASLVLYILDRHLRRSGGGTSLGLSRVIPKIFLSAITGEMRDNMLSTTSFLRICRKLNGIELKSWADQWIYASGCPVFQVSAYFNRKKLTHELSLKQLNRSKAYYEDKQTSWSERANLKPMERFEGQMTIRIHESDGIPYEHVLDIKEPFKRYELPSNHKTKKFKRSSRRYGSSHLVGDANEDPNDRFSFPPWERSQRLRDRWLVEDWTEEDDLLITTSSVEWIRLDVELEWICEFRFEMKEFMWIEQLQRDRDVVAQLEAIRALKSLPSKVVSSHLCRTVLVPEYFFRIRVEAALALVSCAIPRCNFLGLFHLLKLFQTRYAYPPQSEPNSPWNVRAIPKPNRFDNFTEYFIRKAIVVALSRVRDQNLNSPSICQQFFLDQLIYNDNSLNSYSDTHYLATTIAAMADSFIHLADDGQRGESSELFGTKTHLDSGPTRPSDQRLALMVNELERCFMADRLVPSYRNLIAMAVVEAKFKLMIAGLLPIDWMFFLLCTRPGNYLSLRILGFDCLLLLRGFQEKAIVRYMFITLRDDPSLLVRRRLAMGLVQCLPILVLLEELGVEPSERDGLSVIDEPRQNTVQHQFDHKTVTKHLRAEVGRALILRECIMSVMLDPTIDTDVQTCLLKISEVLFKPSDESVPIRIAEEKPPIPQPPTPVLTKIRIPAPPVAIEAQPAPQAPLPKIVLKDHQHDRSNELEIPPLSPVHAEPAAELSSSKLSVSLVRKQKPPPKPKKFQTSGMSIPDHKMCQNLLKKMVAHPLSLPFRKPVDPIRESAPNYFNIISNPMDLKTMGMKLEMGQYPDREAFKDDVNLIFSNCKTYNLPDSTLVVKYAEPLKIAFEKLWERSEKTMSAIQAKGLVGVNPSWLQPTGPKLLVAPNNVVPLAPPPSFAAFAAGGSMIPPPPPVPSSSPAAPVSPARPPSGPPSRMSPEVARTTGGLKVKLKPKTSASPSLGTLPEIVPGNMLPLSQPPPPPPGSKSSLKIKFTPSSSSILPAPPPPIVSIAPFKARMPPNPFTPPPPPPSFESFSLASQISPKTTLALIPHEMSPSELDSSAPGPPSSTQVPKRNHLIVQFPKPPSTTSSGPTTSIGLDLQPPPVSELETPIPSSKVPKPSSHPTKIKLVQRSGQRPVPHQQPPQTSSSSVLSPPHPPEVQIKPGSHIALEPLQPSPSISIKKPKSKKPPVNPAAVIDPSSGYRSSPPFVPPQTPDGSHLPLATTPNLVAEMSPPREPEAVASSSRSVIGAGTGVPAEGGTDPGLNRKKAKAIIRKMMDHPQGIWFRIPVDPVAVGAPTYLDEIKHPMDLSTMAKKLDQGLYPSRAAIDHDFELIVSNCAQFNGPNSILALDAQTLKKAWIAEWEKAKKLSYNERRSLLGLINRLNQIPGVVDVFGAPVDPEAYQIPTYYTVIGGAANARDLGTMKKKLGAELYTSVAEFEADVRLMLRNCFAFNPPASPVAAVGRDLQAVFDTAFAKIATDHGLVNPPPDNNSPHAAKRKGAEAPKSSKRSKIA